MPFTLENFFGSQTSEKLDTQIAQVPPGREYLVIIPSGRMDINTFTYGKGEKIGQVGYQLVLFVEVLNEPNLKEEMGRDPIIRDSFTLDISADGTSLDMGKHKNTRLGQYREACGQNIDGQPWSPQMLYGIPFVALAGVETDKRNGNILTKVSAVRKHDPSVPLAGART